jgi:hypothetical protein
MVGLLSCSILSAAVSLASAAEKLSCAPPKDGADFGYAARKQEDRRQRRLP